MERQKFLEAKISPILGIGGDRQIATIDPLGSLTTTTYDAAGNVLSITDAVNNTTSYVYDDLNRLIAETNQLEATRYYRYDAQSNRIAAIDRNGRERAFLYDGLNRQVEEQWLDEGGTAIRSARMVYDAASQLVEVSDPDSTYRYSYDSLGRQVAINNAGTPDMPNVVLNYAYDDAGNIVSVTDTIDGVAGGTNTYRYDALNRTTQVTQSSNSVSDKRVDFTYTPVGQFETISRYSDLTGNSPGVTTTYNYDDSKRLERLSHSSTTEEVAFYNYRYDSASRITRITNVDGVSDYSYNDRDELTGAIHSNSNNPDESYDYDANGNREQSSVHGSDYVTGSNNQLVADGLYTYEYDDEGNMTQQTETATANVRTFEWDYRNRLVGVVDLNSTGVEVQQVTYTYDAMGQRISKVVDADGTGSAAAKTLRFVYDRGDVLLEIKGENAKQSQRYLHGPQIDQVLAQEDEKETVLWYLNDHIGTIKDLVDNAGIIVNHRIYDAYGNLIVRSDDSFDSRYSFTGREFDIETGLYYYRARYYNSSNGKFISQDPISFAAGDTNLQRYVLNHPTALVDPSGLAGKVNYQLRTLGFFSTFGPRHMLATPDANLPSGWVRGIGAQWAPGQIRVHPLGIFGMMSGAGDQFDLNVDPLAEGVVTPAAYDFTRAQIEWSDNGGPSGNSDPWGGKPSGDENGHIIPKVLGGSNQKYNMFAQQFKMNRGGYNSLGRQINSKLEELKKCNVPSGLDIVISLDHPESGSQPGVIAKYPLRPFRVTVEGTFFDGTRLKGRFDNPMGRNTPGSYSFSMNNNAFPR